MYLARNGVVIGGQYAAYGFCNAAHRLRVAASFNKLFLKVFFSKSSGIPPSLRYGATLPGLRTRRSSKAKVVSGASRTIPLPEPALITNP
jgi:hypothetical protein